MGRSDHLFTSSPFIIVVTVSPSATASSTIKSLLKGLPQSRTVGSPMPTLSTHRTRCCGVHLILTQRNVFSLSRMCDQNAPYTKTYLPLGAGDRVRRIKQKAVASFKIANPTKPDGGIGSFPSSTRIVELQGLQDNTVYNHGGVYGADVGCCSNN